jgi:hypothetical protein
MSERLECVWLAEENGHTRKIFADRDLAELWLKARHRDCSLEAARTNASERERKREKLEALNAGTYVPRIGDVEEMREYLMDPEYDNMWEVSEIVVEGWGSSFIYGGLTDYRISAGYITYDATELDD